jgi:hypothetical protein
MGHNPGYLTRLIGFVLIILLPGCSLPGRGIETSTVTTEPLSSETPYANTPQPPLSITVCPVESECPPVVLLDDMIGRMVEAGTYDVSIPFDKPVRVRVMWWAASPTALVDNLVHIHWVFEIDGQNYFSPDMIVQYLAPYDEEKKTQADSISLTATLDGWKVNEPHTIRIGYYFDEAVNDGWQDNPAGFSQIYIYNVTPSLPETPTAAP